ncbi:hypothetical protein FQZ97_738560 [compost metagenome]
MAHAALRRAGLRNPLAVHRRHSRGRPEGDLREDLHGRGVRHRRDRAAARARRWRVPRSPVQRPHAGLQGHGDAALGQPVRVRTGPPRRRAQHPGRHQRRHRQRGRVRHARQEGRARLHAQPARPHEPVPAGADVQPDGREHPQHRDRRRVRRLPRHRQERQQRPRIQTRPQNRYRELDQLGAAAGPGRLLLRRVLPSHHQGHRAGLVHRAQWQFRQRMRRPRGAPDGPADRAARGRDQRERRA